jgi:hypothetical protein
MSCMLRIAGVKLDIDRLLAAVPLKPTMSYRKGEPCRKTEPRGRRNKYSGAGFLVSDADFDQFDEQKKDAIAFLKAKKAVIRKIMRWPGVDGGGLDFGIKRRDVFVACDYFPEELVRLAGGLGLSIELSQYPIAEEERKGRKPTSARTSRRVPRRR